MRRSPSLHNILLALVLLFGGSAYAAEEARPLVVLHVQGTIDPAVSRYIARGLEEARNIQANAVLIRLDTPGGLDGSMRKIVQAILDSPVPVIVYVSPQGARAASAGVFITMAAHVAAMAPATNIGAAHPVQLGADKTSTAVEQKMTNDAVAYMTSIAELRGRNTDWAADAVHKSRSSNADEASQNRVVDLLAADTENLLGQLEGRLVKTAFGTSQLSFKGTPRKLIPMNWVEQGLHQLAQPSLAYILLLLGIYGLIYELATPGAVFPGVVGAIFLVLGLVALETLEVNWGGILLIGLSLLFFIGDIKLPGYGALTIGGVIAFVIGSGFLFRGPRLPDLQLPWAIIGAAAGVTAAFFLGIVGAGLRALKRKVTSGAEGLIGAEGFAKTDVRPSGVVQIQGEEWQAWSSDAVFKGDRVKVVRLDGLTVVVQRIEKEPS